MTKPLFRGLLIAAFFALVAAVLIPVYVPRPAFIPGFAPPPNMWPRTVALIGTGLGLLAIVQAVLGRGLPNEELIETDGAPVATMVLRALGAAAAFAGFVLVVPLAGFPIAAMALTGLCILLTGERGHVLWALAISILGPLLLLTFFQQALGTQFPKGMLTTAIGI
ncbi:tripartite tricarboxylate transporter TctB family protein [Phaeobacter gallaeciensis]|uniref:tripartite tricarboxylate transporter TctB family protein n=1 Tax=Phaeobacter gallaeciensis TaxID=60890 RepID=UPI00237F928B|nr:tripartite tricarboxylate transporter TctB family protein [Phaeobacter gallaeciensis]MDE4191876.1 tripartite tricarboxylate transporter TctB family protein [Phaeobacter gallaeciensis]MDE4200339.1 tripartite tricarboxylate transporter TctB family protein [Phaeobacter gallaeciensis]MDE4204213.1 tripartite tricarboxylate transporter TctB family protein [Phaeobacter gallaeciensis]MDE4208631.1 tripartite tricarboxylate transporter TctB family protein [Phaeobacter gallaeciensis]MDE4216722.1 tripa